MPMSREEHEALLSELLNPEIDHSRKTDILQQIRVDHVTAHSEVEDLTKQNTKFKTDNDDLIISNSKLFRQLGVTETKEPEVKKKEFSETITIEEIEKGL
jgi:regulator of replication initiation timing